MPKNRLAPDQSVRNQALDITRSCAIAAPAGSGKTELLTQRILKLLSCVDRPEAVLAITFTRKAAAEMRQRILQALEDAEQNRDCESGHQQFTRDLATKVLARDEELNWHLLSNINRLQIQTIDSLCRRFAVGLPLESGISLPNAVSDQPDMLYQMAAHRTVVYLESSHPIADDLALLISHLHDPLERLLVLLGQMLQSRDSWLQFILDKGLTREWLQDALLQLAEEKLQAIYHDISHWQGQLGELIDYALAQGGENLDAKLNSEVITVCPTQDELSLPQWQSLANFLLVKNQGATRQTVTKNEGFPAPKDAQNGDLAKQRKAQMLEVLHEIAEQPYLVRTLHSIRSLPAPEVSKEQWNLIESLTRVLLVMAAELRLLQQEQGQCDHTEVSIAALRALGEAENPTPLIQRLDYRIQHILVDEFQDTSSIQIALLERLTSGWETNDGRTFFMVGDAMQSIYEFRKANVALFRRVRHHGINDLRPDSLDLRTNFRSRPALVDWVNTKFQHILGASHLEDQGFETAVAFRSPSDSSQVHHVAAANTSDEANAIVDHIRDLQQKGEQDIAILVRARAHLNTLLPALHKAGIQWHAKDIDPLHSRMSVVDIESLTRAICCPADRIAWLSILRAPWSGLDMADLLFLVEHNLDTAPKPIWQNMREHKKNSRLSAAGHKILERLVLVCSHAMACLGQRPLRQVIEQAWLALDGPSGLLNTNDHLDIEDYLNFLEQQAPLGMVRDWTAFGQNLKKLYARATVSDENAIQIMTIHAAKGLEFNHVILPGLARDASSGGDNPLLVWWEREFQDGVTRFLLSPKARRDKDNSLYRYLLDEQRERQGEEQLRLFYVAATRAKESLFLSAVFKFDSKGNAKAPTANSMLGRAWSALEVEFNAADLAPLPEKGSDNPSLNGWIRRLSPDRQLPALPPLTDCQFPGEQSADFLARYSQRIVGDLLHEDLHTLATLGLAQSNLDHCRSSWLQRLRSGGLSSDLEERILDQLHKALDQIATSTAAEWILRAHDNAASEQSFHYQNDLGNIAQAIVDRTFIDERCRWIIDYKSAQPAENESLQAFIDRQCALYTGQLYAYANLFEADLPVRAALYFPLIDHLQELELSNQ